MLCTPTNTHLPKNSHLVIRGMQTGRAPGQARDVLPASSSAFIAPQQAGQRRHAAPSTGRLRGEGWVSGASESPVGEHLGSKTQDAPTAGPAGGGPCPRDAGHGPKEGNGLTARDSQRPSSRPVGFAQHEGLTFPCPLARWTGDSSPRETSAEASLHPDLMNLF